jgi:hypothetical protein
MADIIKSDLFFFITSVAVIVLSILSAAILIYALLLVRSLKKIVDTFKEESAEIVDDLHELRTKLKEKESLIGKGSALFFFFRSIFGKKSRKRKE